VVDECHRGGASDESSWRGILEYFSDAVQLGLTATPRRTENVDTYAYFGDPVYSYSLKEGINDGFLTPFRVHQISTTLDEYQYSPADKVVAGEVDVNHVYTDKDFNKKIEIVAREAARVKVFMDLIKPSDKTIVFCGSQAHALLVRDLVNQYKKNPDANYCHRVTADEGAIGDQHLADFQDNEKTIPTILTTSQKLTTGVDALNVRNIVLLRPINSMVEFKQIIGRGTRLFEGKEYFTVFDFVKAHHLFSDPEWDGDPEPPDDSGTGAGTGTGTGTEEPGGGVGTKPRQSRPEMIQIELPDGSLRQVAFMINTTFWGSDGQQLTVEQFLQSLFGELPNFYKSEEDLRQIWSDPLTRIELLTKLADKGFGIVELEKLQELISAVDSDLFDVLAYISFKAQMDTRKKRAASAKGRVASQLSGRTTDFIDFVLQQYEKEGVKELNPDNLFALVNLRYHTLNDAVEELGADGETIRDDFYKFQQFLYDEAPA
jgi:type I restriction enzyme R subunit